MINGTDGDIATGFQPTATCSGPDADSDGVTDANDNCPLVANADQDDKNNNGIGDACETPTISFTATTTKGSVGSTSNGSTVSIDFCDGGSFTFSGFGSNVNHIGTLEEFTSSGNVTYAGSPISSRAQNDLYIHPDNIAVYFSGTYGAYGLTSGTYGSITQKYTPYYDANFNNHYDVGEPLGSPVTLVYNIYSKPIITCPGDKTVSTDPGVCTSVVNYSATSSSTLPATTSYKFTGATSGSNSGTGTGATFNKGTTTVTVTATNACGTVSCTFTVTVIDNEKPVVACPLNQTLSPATLAGTVVTYTTPAVSDNCPGVGTPVRTAGPPSGSIFPIGTTIVSYKVTDASGNVGTCSFTVTVIDPYCDKNDKDKKVYMCHKGNTICVSVNAIDAHMGHGDYLGACSNITSAAISPDAITKENSKAEVLSYKISNYPNPFSHSTKIQYSIPYTSKVLIKVYDMMGRVVATLVDGEKHEGIYTADFNAAKHADGVYYYKLIAVSKGKEFTQTGKMIRIK